MKSRNPTLHPATHGDKTTPVQKFVTQQNYFPPPPLMESPQDSYLQAQINNLVRRVSDLEKQLQELDPK